MTRQEFYDKTQRWGWADLMDFCYDVGCEEIVSDIITEDEVNDSLRDDITNMLQSGENWQGICAYLEEVPRGYDYYRIDGYGYYLGIDDVPFDDYLDDVALWLEANEYYDDWYDEEDDDEFDYNEEAQLESGMCADTQPIDDDSIPLEAEDISITELLFHKVI